MRVRKYSKLKRLPISPKPLPRPRRLVPGPAKPYLTEGGPLAGHRIYLRTPNTLPIVVHGIAGHYSSGAWVPSP
jgi:hypothetical protein